MHKITPLFRTPPGATAANGAPAEVNAGVASCVVGRGAAATPGAATPGANDRPFAPGQAPAGLAPTGKALAPAGSLAEHCSGVRVGAE